MKKLNQARQLRKTRIHRKIRAQASRPRLLVCRSLKNISAQIIDNESGKTLMSASSINLKSQQKNKTEIAAQVGSIIAKKALQNKINSVAFDRGRYKYHGRIKALADAARKEGLVF